MARYSPGLDWLLPGNWLTGAPIKNLYDQSKKDHKWRIAFNDLEKDFPSDGSKRDPKANARLKTLIAKENQLKGVGYKGKEGTPDNPTEIGGIIPQGPVSSVKADLTYDDAQKNLINQKNVASTNARASLIRAAEGTDKRMGQSPSKGSVGKGLARIQEIRNEQNPVAQASATTTTNVESVQTQSQAPTQAQMDQKALENRTPIDQVPEKARAGYIKANPDLVIPKTPTPNQQASTGKKFLGKEVSKGQQAAGTMSNVLAGLAKLSPERAPVEGLTIHTGAKSPDDDYLTALASMKFYG